MLSTSLGEPLVFPSALIWWSTKYPALSLWSPTSTWVFQKHLKCNLTKTTLHFHPIHHLPHLPPLHLRFLQLILSVNGSTMHRAVEAIWDSAFSINLTPHRLSLQNTPLPPTFHLSIPTAVPLEQTSIDRHLKFLFLLLSLNSAFSRNPFTLLVGLSIVSPYGKQHGDTLKN